MIGTYALLLIGLLIIVAGTVRERREWAEDRDMVEQSIWHAAMELGVHVDEVRAAVVNVMPGGEIVWLEDLASTVPVERHSILAVVERAYMKVDEAQARLIADRFLHAANE